jgi:hypothetical protein
MRTASIVAGACAFGAATFAMTRNAHALGPVDLEIGAKVGFGTNPVSNSNAGVNINNGGININTINPLGFGVGGRAGVSFLGFYGGAQLMYYFGGSQDISVPGVSAVGISVPGQSVSVSAHTLMYGVEAGYGITLIDILTIRPQIGIGNGTVSCSTSASGLLNTSGGCGSQSSLYLEPGVTGLIGLGMWFVGADANVLVFTGLDNSKAAFTLHGQVGVKF